MNIKKSWCVDNNGKPVFDENVKKYISVRPSKRQLLFNDVRYYNFIHFGMNTFTDREWGKGHEDPKIFNPSKLDTDMWCEVLKNGGSKGIVFTVKHHDGFCLYDSKFTEHTVISSPFKQDILKLLSKSCQKYKLKLGIYLSPWDMTEKLYGTDGYNDFFVNQLQELSLNYGEIFCFWFDGACGEGENGKKQVYDFKRYYEVIRKYQPNAVISITGPDVRWIGNEGGKTRKSEWSVVPFENISGSSENSQKREDEPPINFDPYNEDLGSREKLLGKNNLIWYPAEADVSINGGWFYHDDKYYFDRNENPSKSPSALSDIFLDTVGGNASMLLNVPPDKDGVINEREIKTLNEFANILRSVFYKKVLFNLSILTIGGDEIEYNQEGFMLHNNEAGFKIRGKEPFDVIFIEEDVKYSQRIEEFEIFERNKKIYEGSVIGSGKIIRFNKNANLREINVIITQSRSNPVIKKIELYKQKN